MLSLMRALIGRLTIPLSLARTLYEREPRSVEPTLTEREAQVLGAIAQRFSNRQIAEQLNIGANTIRTHVGNLLHKLALSNRTELDIYALKRNPARNVL